MVPLEDLHTHFGRPDFDARKNRYQSQFLNFYGEQLVVSQVVGVLLAGRHFGQFDQFVVLPRPRLILLRGHFQKLACLFFSVTESFMFSGTSSLVSINFHY